MVKVALQLCLIYEKLIREFKSIKVKSLSNKCSNSVRDNTHTPVVGTLTK